GTFPRGRGFTQALSERLTVPCRLATTMEAGMAWQDYTPEQLEWQYNPRVTVADAGAYIQRLKTLSADTLAVLTRHADIRYGPGPKETFDLYPAATAGPTPVHVFFHGGYWRAQDKTDF